MRKLDWNIKIQLWSYRLIYYKLSEQFTKVSKVRSELVLSLVCLGAHDSNHNDSGKFNRDRALSCVEHEISKLYLFREVLVLSSNGCHIKSAQMYVKYAAEYWTSAFGLLLLLQLHAKSRLKYKPSSPISFPVALKSPKHITKLIMRPIHENPRWSKHHTALSLQWHCH